jgi:hypothetical protein
MASDMSLSVEGPGAGRLRPRALMACTSLGFVGCRAPVHLSLTADDAASLQNDSCPMARVIHLPNIRLNLPGTASRRRSLPRGLTRTTQAASAGP